MDGDTIVYNSERVRLYGLDCAERFQEEGRRATAALRALLEGNVLRLERVPQARDSREKCRQHDHKCKHPGFCDCYGRTVSKVHVQRTTRAEFFTLDASCWMIQQGVCKEYKGYSHGYYERCKP